MMRIFVMIICLFLVVLPGASFAIDGSGKGVGRKSGMNSENGPSPSDPAYEHASGNARFMHNESSSSYENREGTGDRERYAGDHDRDRSGDDDDDQQESKDKSKGNHEKKQKAENESVEDNNHKRHKHEMERKHYDGNQIRDPGDKER